MSNHNLFHYFLTVLVYLARNLIIMFASFLIGLSGFFIFQSQKSPFDKILGLPLFLIGLGFFVNSLLSIILSFFSSKFNKAECVICKKD